MATIEIGAFVRSKTCPVVVGFVTGEGTLKMGRKSLPAYTVRLAADAQAVILADDIEEIAGFVDCTPPTAAD